MNGYANEADQERTLQEKYEAEAGPLFDRLVEEVRKATGIKPKIDYAASSGPHRSFWLEGFSINVIVQHEFIRSFRGRHSGNAEVVIHWGYFGGGRRKVTFPKRQDGTWNIEKIVKDISDRIKGQRAGEKATQERERKEAESKEIMARELADLKLPEGVVVGRDPNAGTYYLRTGGTFSGLDAAAVVALAKALGDLFQAHSFEKDWRINI